VKTPCERLADDETGCRDRAYRFGTDDDFIGDLLPFLTGFGVCSASESLTIGSLSDGEIRDALQVNS